MPTQPQNYTFPVRGYRGQVAPHWGSNRGGADLFATPGTPVVAMVGGTVTYSGTDPIGGNNVTIRGNDGLTYYYAHLEKQPLVQAGQSVATGTPIGTVGDTGNAKGTGAHLHIGIGQGIVSGTGPAGGTGANYDATGLLNRVAGGQARPAGGEPMDEDDDNWDMIADGEGEPTDDQYDYHPPDEPGRNGTTSGGTGRKPPQRPAGNDYQQWANYYRQVQQYYLGLADDADNAGRAIDRSKPGWATQNEQYIEQAKSSRAAAVKAQAQAEEYEAKWLQQSNAKAPAPSKLGTPGTEVKDPAGLPIGYYDDTGQYRDYSDFQIKTRIAQIQAGGGLKDIPKSDGQNPSEQLAWQRYQDEKAGRLTPSEQVAWLRYQDDKAAQAIADQIAQGRLSFDQAKEDFFQGAENRRLLNQRQQMAGSMFGTANEQVLRGAPYATLPGRDTFPGFGAGEAAEQASRLLGAKFSPIQWQPIAFDPRGDAERILQGGYDLPEIPRTVGNNYPIPTGTRRAQPAAAGNVAGPIETFGYVDPGALANAPASPSISPARYPMPPVGAWNPGEPMPDTAGPVTPMQYPYKTPPAMSMEEWEAQGAGVPQTYPVPETPEERARREQQEYLAGVGAY